LATETFAMGVNMPTKSVVFTNVTKFDGHQKRIFRTEEYGQMAGRAGRRGLDTQGTVIILPFIDFITESEAKLIMLAPPQKIQSKFSIDYSLILKLLNHMIDSNNQEDTIKYLTKVLSNTLFNGQDSKQNNHLIGDKKIAVEKLENIQKFLDKNAIEKRPLYERLKQIETELKPSGFFKLDKKQEKTLLKEKSSLEVDMSPSTYRSIDSWVTLENQVKKITNEIEFNETKLQIHIEKIISFLEKKGMVQIDATQFKLSEKGRIVAEINECNSLIMSKIIESSLLDDLDFNEIMGILSLFVADKDRKDIYISDLDITTKEKEIIKTICKFSEELYDDEIKLVQDTPFQFKSEWNLAFNMYETIKEWSAGKTWLEILASNNIKKEEDSEFKQEFEGNFIKNVLRLTNLTRNIETIAKLLNNTKLLNKLDGYQEKLIKGIVITDSLYL
jgi:superfamily II RNA helicase